jgi:hypothetical protein
MMMLVALALAFQEPTIAQEPDPIPEVAPHPKKRKKQQQDQEDLPGAVRPKPEDMNREGKKKRDDYDLGFRVGMTLEYNDNIIRLDEDDLKAFHDGTKPEKFRIKSPEDWIFSPWGEIDLALHVFGEPSRVGLRVMGHLYQSNTFASNEAFTVFLKGKPYSLEYTFEPSVYRREYRNLDTGVYESAFYDDHLFEAAVKIPASEVVMFRPKAGVEIRDYDAPFTFRSSVAPFVAPRVIFAVSDLFEPFFQYEFVYNQAFASGVQPDTTYYQNGVEVGVSSKVARGLEFEVKYRYEHRLYTSDNDPSFDSHAGRKDARNRFTVGGLWKAAEGLSIEASFTQWVVDSTVKDPDEDSDWSRRQVLLGFMVVF